jgi:hypothetical protein
MISFRGMIQGGLTVLVSSIQRRALVHQESNDNEVAVLCGHVEWRFASTIRGVDLGTQRQERAYNIGMSSSGGEVEGCSTVCVPRIGSSSIFEYVLDDTDIPEIGGLV